jgi:ATP-dependent Clp protease ATP-binding subunit ClpC
MEKELQKVVVGQKEAISSICRALRRSRADMRDPRRPIGSFVFLGSTGVGKTMLAKMLAEFMFDDSDALLQIDMSEYMEKFAVSRLLGSPPGYVGHGEGGQLTEKVRRRPYSVVLFDEVEKAHPDVMHTLLQILEEGSITDSMGRKVDFRNTLIILTSNLGGSGRKTGHGLGFGKGSTSSEYANMKERMIDSARETFNPEFLNRFDDIVVFRELRRRDIIKILDLELAKVSDRLKKKGLRLEISPEARKFLVEKGYDPKLGARPLRRTVEKYLEDALVEQLLRGGFDGMDVIGVNLADGALVFEQPSLAE